VSEYDRESTFGIISRESVEIGVTESVVENLDSNLVLLGRINRNLFDRDGFTCFPCDSCTPSFLSVLSKLY